MIAKTKNRTMTMADMLKICVPATSNSFRFMKKPLSLYMKLGDTDRLSWECRFLRDKHLCAV